MRYKLDLHPMLSLTKKQREILGLIYAELSNREIADKLEISIRTVETHRKNIYKKTGTSGIVGLIKYGLSNRLIQ
ncbi:MAG: helix-turn-helix transcriptional regulator [Sphingobacteriaceae bacterium]|nr:helix-turn-helix transcriptional regulator [Sphingobacteriaceae bacterium]